MSLPPRKILLVATIGFTHAAPVLELGRVLSQRGHTIEFAALDGQDVWLKDYHFIKKAHLMGPSPNKEEVRAHFERMRLWDASKGFRGAFTSKYLFEASWPRVYRYLKDLMENEATRPDMIVSDYYVEAVKDIHIQFKVPLAVVWPQFPFGMLPCSYIPGQPGLQIDIALTSEQSSLWSRIRNELVILTILPDGLKLLRWINGLRREAGLKYPLPIRSKPDYLILVNSFFGLEAPRDLPPLAAIVGPILADEYPALDSDCASVLNSCTRVVYIGFGTRVILPAKEVEKILQGLALAMNSDSINGVIWALPSDGRQGLNRKQTIEIRGQVFTFGDLLKGHHPRWRFPTFAPQRAILEHPSTKVYFTHGGGSSSNEGSFHGNMMLCLPFSFDQLCNSARLSVAGTAECIDKTSFTSDEIAKKIRIMIEDVNGAFERNCLRMKYISRVSARNKSFGASLIEQVLFDTELRISDGIETRPMHLETADMRMPIWKARNWDLIALLISFVGGSIISAWWVSKLLCSGIVNFWVTNSDLVI